MVSACALMGRDLSGMGYYSFLYLAFMPQYFLFHSVMPTAGLRFFSFN